MMITNFGGVGTSLGFLFVIGFTLGYAAQAEKKQNTKRKANSTKVQWQIKKISR